jgi:cytochrome c553
MSEHRAEGRDRWAMAAIGMTAAIAVAGAIAGFAWLPWQQPGARFSGVWDAICSAAGLVGSAPVGVVVQADHPVTRVAVTQQMFRRASPGSIGRGATLALRCTMCHGAPVLGQGGVGEAGTPNLAGQYPAAIYKQLMDFRTGARVSAVMTPLVADLGEPEMRDLAAYYAYLPRVAGRQPAAVQAPGIVTGGAPLRGIAPCGACHGELDNKPGAPWLEGEPESYLRAQLEAFAAGRRRNDIDGQMRNVARAMTPEEIAAASRWYAGATLR